MGKAVHSYSAFDISRAGESINISYSENVHSSHERKKARRLTMEQTRALENSFELGKIPEAGRKEELAGALGLQPTQIAIWFQNRRAKWKTAQLEKDYRSLNQNYGSLKAQYHTLLEENKKLRSEIQRSGSISKNGQSRHDKEVMGDGQTDFNTVQEKKVECYSVHNAEDHIRHQVCIEENCGHNALVAIEEEDCYRNMGGVSSFMFEDHWTPGFH